MSQFPIAHSLLELRLDLPVWLCSSFAFGQDIAVQTVQLGNPALQAAYAVWPVELAGGFVPNIVYGVYLLRKNDTWKLFKVQQRDFVYATPMGVLWMGLGTLRKGAHRNSRLLLVSGLASLVCATVLLAAGNR